MEFPVVEIEGALFKSIEAGASRFVVSAPTGSGKSTALPAMLSRRLGGQIFVLQPRRVAARMLARSVEKLFPGVRAGWHIRFEKKYDGSTDVVFLTEGILARMLLAGRLPENVSAVIFDEFHERNIYADLSLALALAFQRKNRPGLKLFACSASMDSAALAEYMGAEAFECRGRVYDIDIQYSDLAGRGLPVWDCAAREFARRAGSVGGNFLIFMPGAYEIGKTVSKILQTPQARGMQVLSLHGDMQSAEQDKILSPSGGRKVIVSTNIAETSLTVEGVNCVIDSGLAKVLRCDFSRAVNTLLTERISMASAIQRAGRAGRLAAGVAVRLWRKADERSMAEFLEPEIARVDLSQTLLWLLAAGVDLEGLDLFEKPPQKSLEAAFEILRLLGAIDGDSNITAEGREMARFPTSPRLAKMFAQAAERGCLADAALLAGVVEAGRIKLDLDGERREFERASLCAADSEPEEIMALCRLARENSFSRDFCAEFGVHAANARKAFALAAEYFRLAREIFGARRGGGAEEGALAKCVLAAYPDRVCRRLNAGTLACRMVGGAGCEARKTSKKYASEIFAAMFVQETNGAGGVSLVAEQLVPVKEEWLREVFPGDLRVNSRLRLDENQKRVCSSEELCYKDLPLRQKTVYEVSETAAADLLSQKIFSGEIALKNFDDKAKEFIERVNFLAAAMPETSISSIDGDALKTIFSQMCVGMYSLSEVKNADVLSALKQWLSAEQMEALRYYLPAEAAISPKRRPAKIRYDASAMRAVVPASFKDLFGFDASKIRICGGKIKPTFEILAPNGRPVQTTQDLTAFWATSWQNIRKDIKARYPKHFPPTAPW